MTDKTDHVTSIARFIASHTGGSVQMPPNRTGKGVSFNDSMQVPMEYLAVMAKFWLMRGEIQKVATDALRHSPLKSSEEVEARALLGKIKELG